MTTPTTARSHIRKPSSSTTNSPASSVISKGGTARSAVSSPRVQSSLSSSATPTRRTSLRARAPSPLHQTNGVPAEPTSPSQATVTKDTLATALKQETEEKEGLLVRLQEHEQQLDTLHSESDELKATLKAAETRLSEFYSDQARMEDELAAHHAIADKLREQLKEVEKEKRDLNRRYNEQTKSFEAERQSFYDNEQHLKSRIQSLTQARKTPETPRSGRNPATPLSPPDTNDSTQTDEEAHDESTDDIEVRQEETSDPVEPNEELNEDDSDDTPEVSALKLELSTLSTSYNSLQTTLQHLQTQLADLQRVNQHLQDENESYNILLREKTITGQFDILRQLGGDEGSIAEGDTDGRSIRSTNRSTLDRVSELEELAVEDEVVSEIDPFEERPSSRTSNHTGRRVRSGASSPMTKGESLAGLPLTGPGLDLAAELGRAENRDPIDAHMYTANESPMKTRTPKRTRVAEIKTAGEVDTLRTEVKALKEANKALSLYASKILDRIIAQEGFEQVLAVDYTEDNPKSPQTAVPVKEKKARPQSAFFSNLLTSPPAVEEKESSMITTPASPTPESKRQRRSMTFDWKSLSPWAAAAEKKPEPSNLRQLTLRPGAASIVGAKKLETHEDEEDRVERERLNATMKLMGIDKPQAIALSKGLSAPGEIEHAKPVETTPAPANKAANRRWSLFRSATTATPEQSSAEAAPLTVEALKHAEASEALKQLDESERSRIEELSKGSGSGFTEMKPRTSLSDEWRSRRDARLHGSTGSASTGTVWSAGREDNSIRLQEGSVSGSRSRSPAGSP